MTDVGYAELVLKSPARSGLYRLTFIPAASVKGYCGKDGIFGARAEMTLHVAATADADALAVRDHILPILREHGGLEDLDAKNSPLRLMVLDRQPWRFVHWTPFNALAASQASSPGYRHALQTSHTRPDLPYGLDVWHDGENVLSLLWADAGTAEILKFRRGAWEAAAMAL